MTAELSLVPYAPNRPTWIEAMDRGSELAETIANTDFVPKSLRGNPAAILAAILYGHELGLEPMRSLSWVHVIDGRPALAAAAQRALILSAGHELWVEESTVSRAVVAGRRRDGKQTIRVTWTLDDAKRARIAGKPNWQSYPRQMLVARATSELAQQLFADVIGGIPSTADLDVYDGDVEAEVVEDEAPTERKSSTRRRKRPSPQAPPEPEPEDPTPAEPEPPSEAATRKMFALFGEKLPRLTSREARLEYCSNVVGRPITSSSELSALEVGRLIEDLEAREPPSGEMPDPDGGTTPAPEPAPEPEPLPLPGDEPTPAGPATEPATDAQRRRIASRFHDLGIDDRAERFAWCSKVIGREVTSAAGLTTVEATEIALALQRELDAAL